MNNIDWFYWLQVSALLFFNAFCIAGTILTLYLMIIAGGLYKKVSQTMENMEERVQTLENSLTDSLTDWSWVGGPVSSVISNLFYNFMDGGKKKRNWFSK